MGARDPFVVQRPRLEEMCNCRLDLGGGMVTIQEPGAEPGDRQLSPREQPKTVEIRGRGGKIILRIW
jgi:hypothetical protein